MPHQPNQFELLFLRPFVDFLNAIGNHWVYGLILGVFLLAVTVRYLIYYTVSRHEWFAYEFEKRVSRYLDAEVAGSRQSFYVLVKRLMEKTFYEIFETRDRLKRRKPDKVMSMADRVFLVRQGCAWIVRDTMKQARHLRWGEHPHFINITKVVFHKNPCFNRLLGVIPTGGLNDVLNLLPSLFVIVGIFGTFIGVMKGLPALGEIKPSEAEKAAEIMKTFVNDIAMSMGTSVVGIFSSVMMNVANTVFSPEKAFVGVIDRFENSLVLLWNRANSNDIPRDGASFDENRDAVEALAEAALNQELAKRPQGRDGDTYESPKDKTKAS
ncbi:MAG: hypothetical protein NDI61_07660 [Bdellovibrionaceae bacterium]|nr:hypothetical protein [Pseudobdellovibrionaceae bacterium]